MAWPGAAVRSYPSPRLQPGLCLSPTCTPSGEGQQALSVHQGGNATQPQTFSWLLFFICFQALIYYCEALTQPNLQLQKAACLALRYLKVRDKGFGCGTWCYFNKRTTERCKRQNRNCNSNRQNWYCPTHNPILSIYEKLFFLEHDAIRSLLEAMSRGITPLLHTGCSGAFWSLRRMQTKSQWWKWEPKRCKSSSVSQCILNSENGNYCKKYY